MTKGKCKNTAAGKKHIRSSGEEVIERTEGVHKQSDEKKTPEHVSGAHEESKENIPAPVASVHEKGGNNISERGTSVHEKSEKSTGERAGNVHDGKKKSVEKMEETELQQQQQQEKEQQQQKEQKQQKEQEQQQSKDEDESTAAADAAATVHRKEGGAEAGGAVATELRKAEEAEAGVLECTDYMLKEAEKLKQEGNKFFKEGLFHHAEEKYSTALQLLSEHLLPPEGKQLQQVILCNRAFCHIKLENYGSAVVDADRVLQANPQAAKAYYRRGCAYCCLLKYKKALKDFERVIALSPSSPDKDAVTRLNECKKQIRLEAFAAAIETSKSMRASELLRKEGVEKLFPVEEKYDGPVYETNRCNGEFLVQLVEYLKDPSKRLHKRYAYQIALDMVTLLQKCSSLERVQIADDERFTVCGDVHGQYYDLCNIFAINGMPSKKNPYLFNGDFVDRGSFSVECILLLYAAKLAYPEHFHLTRGNHETVELNKLYGFKGEMIHKYDERLYNVFSESFRLLPLAFVLNSSVFVVHGGLLSRDGVTLDEINKIERDREPPESGLMTDLLWSDPSPIPGRSPSKRGVACQFGPDVTAAFLEQNNLKLIIRSHEMKDEGYEVEHNGKLITVFSAPNYCDQMKNKGAFVQLDGKTLTPTFTQFEATPHPETRPMQYANPMLSFF